MPGGNFAQQITPEITKTAEELLSSVNQQLKNSNLLKSSSSSSRTVVYYTTQVVNGTNYNIVWSNGSTYTCTSIYKPLPYTKEPPSLSDDVEGTKEEACEKCYKVASQAAD